MTDSSLARVYLDPRRFIGDISPLLFGGFAEHLGRCIYEGIYEPGSPHADENGFRKDVMAELKELDFPVIRYPGGNFVSGYDWKDGVGPKEQRPRRRDLAWQSIESNQFGTNEFIDYCRQIKTLPMLGLNFGTASIQDASDLVEYCNAPPGTKWADLRVEHGYRDPHNVAYWCLGNEMDGPWQIGHLSSAEYGKKAKEAAKMMRWHDPSLKLILCGSSSSGMATYPDWDRETLEICWDEVDYLSLHHYAGNRENDTASFLAYTATLEEHVDTLAAVIRYVKSKKRSKKDVYLCWDEWNVWYKDAPPHEKWTEAPHLLEEVYNLEDALVVAQWLSLFLRKCDVMKIACIAQIVNVIAPLLTNHDSVLRQTIFYPLAGFRKYAKGVALDLLVESPQYETKKYGEMPLLDASASYDEESGKQAVFLVNRSQTESLTVELNWQSDAPTRLSAISQLNGDDPKAANSFENPNRIAPRSLEGVTVKDGIATLTLPPLSFMIATTEI